MSEDRFRALLADLGKATLRGVRKCPKCGTYNGSRGACCKNKQCDAVFREPAAERRRLAADACKLITGTSARLFSLRLRPDKGQEHRGFVQLPSQPAEQPGQSGLPGQASSSPAPTVSSALCFVGNCERGFNNGLQLRCTDNGVGDISMANCLHIEAALQCYAEAQPLTLRNSVLSSLSVNNDIKQEIWLLATETSGPLVQRVSKNIMAVKCKPSPKHPLGYLHFSLFTTKLKDKVEHQFSCSCSSFEKKSNEEIDAMNLERCVHFYACICAFASDPKLAEEFQYYINIDQQNLNPDDSLDFEFNTTEAEKFVGMDLDTLSDDPHLLIFRDNPLTAQNLQSDRLDINDIQIDPSILTDAVAENLKDHEQHLLDNSIISEMPNLEVIDQNAVFDGSTLKVIQDSIMVDKFNSATNNFTLLDSCIKPTNGATIKILDNNLILDSNSIKLLSTNPVPSQVVIEKKPVERKTSNLGKRKRTEDKNLSSITNLSSIEPRKNKTKASLVPKKYLNTCENVDESTTSLSFVRWLSSVTERINQTMHFQFDGKPEPLVFHAPQPFFECLRERISCGTKKKRLPNSTTAFVRRDAVPLGTFTKYTWHITNILHVKSIFETPLVPLEITRSFIQNPDGTYQLYKREEEEIDRFKKTSNNPLIKPLELKTFLKVGNTSPNQVQPTPFLIEWIPDILPVSKIGELRIRFEFGHVKNESPQRWKKVALSKTN